MEEKVSIVIPNFNGRDLLAKNLPKVLKECPKSEVIIVDDASSDDSAAFLKKNFKSVKVIINKKNLGFAQTANNGAKNAHGEFVLFLNTDVAVQANFLNSALSHANNDKLFAVGLADQSHEDGKIVVKGRGGASFIKGFANHFAKKPEAGETLWVSGGSGLFNREKFQELGGFDKIYAPFYWEDIDLSYRARKLGYTCVFDPQAKVDHYHEEGAIKKLHSPNFVKTVAYKNQFLFVWKNITDYMMISKHLLWLPYHFAKALASLDFAFFLGFFWALSQIPALILNYPTTELSNHQLSDKEILNAFS